MKVVSAEFVTSAAGAPKGIARHAPQIAVAGRSNVGKSTLINALCRRKIAYRVRIEGPGTRELYFVDLPGYGYARGGADAAQELRAVAEAYLTDGQPHAVLLLIDSRHPRLDSDIGAHAWFASLGMAPHIVATKIDKLSRAERARNLETLGETFGTAALPVSAQSGEGLDELWQLITRLARSR